MSYCSMSSSAQASIARILADRAAGERRPVVAGEDEVVLEREAHDHRPAVTVAGNVGETGLVERARTPAGHVVAEHRDRRRRWACAGP